MQFRENHILNALAEFSQQRGPLDLFLKHYFKSHHSLGSKDRRFVSDVIYGMIKWFGRVDFFAAKSMSPFDCTLSDWQERLVIWKRIEQTLESENSHLSKEAKASCPQVLFQTLKAAYGEEAALDLCIINNGVAPTTIRVNPLKTSRDALLSIWQGKYSCTPTLQSPLGIYFRDRTHLLGLPEFQEGLFEIQDEGSQLVSNLIDPLPGDQVLDFCAGAGGKTLAFAHKLKGKGQIYLHDVRSHALAKAKLRLRRAGIQNAQFHCTSAQKKRMDWVLADVPCTGIGTLRRNPDLKWKWSLELLSRLVEEQRSIFHEAIGFLKPGGKIVYATCSILPEENEQQVDYFCMTYGLKLSIPPFRSLPVRGGMDGFFAAVLQEV